MWTNDIKREQAQEFKEGRNKLNEIPENSYKWVRELSIIHMLDVNILSRDIIYWFELRSAYKRNTGTALETQAERVNL